MKTNTSAILKRTGLGLLAIALAAAVVCAVDGLKAEAQAGTELNLVTQETLAEEVAEVVEQEPQNQDLDFGQNLSPTASDCLATLEQRLRDSGVPVLSVSMRVGDEGDARVVRENTTEADEVPVVAVRVPSAALENCDLLTIMEIQRQAAAMATAGVPIRILDIVAVDADGRQERTYDMGTVWDRVASPEWRQPARTDRVAAEASARAVVMDAVSQAGLDLVSFSLTEDDLGRAVEIDAVMGADDSGNPGVLVYALFDAIASLNTDSGCKLSPIIVKVDDLGGSPVARAVLDYSMGGGSQGFWLAPEYRDRRDLMPANLQ